MREMQLMPTARDGFGNRTPRRLQGVCNPAQRHDVWGMHVLCVKTAPTLKLVWRVEAPSGAMACGAAAKPERGEGLETTPMARCSRAAAPCAGLGYLPASRRSVSTSDSSAVLTSPLHHGYCAVCGDAAHARCRDRNSHKRALRAAPARRGCSALALTPDGAQRWVFRLKGYLRRRPVKRVEKQVHRPHHAPLYFHHRRRARRPRHGAVRVEAPAADWRQHVPGQPGRAPHGWEPDAHVSSSALPSAPWQPLTAQVGLHRPERQPALDVLRRRQDPPCGAQRVVPRHRQAVRRRLRRALVGPHLCAHRTLLGRGVPLGLEQRRHAPDLPPEPRRRRR